MTITPVCHPGPVAGQPHSRYEVATAESTPARHDARKLCAKGFLGGEADRLRRDRRGLGAFCLALARSHNPLTDWRHNTGAPPQ